MPLCIGKKCCVSNCYKTRSDGTILHCFPNPEKDLDRFRTWLYAIGGDVLALDNKIIHKYGRICHHHFEVRFHTRSKRLCANATPTLNLPGVIPSKHSKDDYALAPAQPTQVLPPTPPPQTPPPLPPPPLSGWTLQEETLKYEDFSEDIVLRWEESPPPPDITDPKPSNEPKRIRRKKKVLRRRELHTNFSERYCRAEKAFNDASFLHALRKTPKLKYMRQRFSLDENIKCLPLYNKNPKIYTLLYKHFVLPSSKTLNKLLNQAVIRPGINKCIFEKLKRTVSEMCIKGRLCTLMFNVMKIKPQMHYNAQTDELQGYATDNKENKLADRVIVFMVKGIEDNFKQPVAFYYTQALKKNDLKKMIVEVIGNVQKTGLRVVCTVCDTSVVNVKTINSLIEDTKNQYIQMKKVWKEEIFEVNNRKIIPVYDVPHLMTEIRNTLVTSDIKYYATNGDQKLKTLKWDYFKMLYKKDKRRGELRFIQKITEEHVNSKKSKMVTHAVQLFSRQVAVAVNALLDENEMPEECSQIIPFALMIDRLFDSFNSNALYVIDHKIYRGGVRKNSPHKEFWDDAKTFLGKITHVCKDRLGDKLLIYERYLPAAQYFIKNIDAMMNICEVLHDRYRVDGVLTRNFNMEPLVNFFGDIRRLSARNSVPNCVSFERAFKILLLNNYKVPFSFGDGRKFSNCEEDNNDCLQKLDFFFNNKTFINDGDFNERISINPYIETFSEIFEDNYYEWEQRHYVCDSYLSKFLKHVDKSCQNCRKTLFSISSESKWPSQDLEKCFFDVHLLIEEMLKRNTVRHKVKDKVRSVADIFVIYPFDCEVHGHGLKSYFLDITINTALNCWCRCVNRILAGKCTYKGNDKLKTAAQYYFYRQS